MKAKIKRVVISPYAFAAIMREGTSWKVSKGIPITAKLAGFSLDPATNNLTMFMEDDSFPDVEVESQVAPLLETEFLKIK